MGLWLKQGDDLVPVGGGGGGSFDGEHVLTGDPNDPPDELQVGQLLYDGDPSTGGGTFDGEHVPTGDPTDPASLDLVDEGQLLFDGVEGGDVGDAGPHSHAQYASVEHDHDDYLPLAGGTVTGDLQVDGSLAASGNDSSFTSRVTMRPTSPNGFSIDYLKHADNNVKWVTSGPREDEDDAFITYYYDGAWNRTLVLWKDRARFHGDLQVDGEIVVEQNLVARASVNFKNVGVGDSAYRHLWMNSNGWLFVADSTRGGPFAPSKLARNSDVLERAETATLPPEPETDESGNQTNTAEVEAHDTVELFDVVTALLAKVKELSATVADQTEKIAALEGN